MYSQTLRVWLEGQGYAYDEYMIITDAFTLRSSIIHVGTFYDGMPSTVNPNSRRYA